MTNRGRTPIEIETRRKQRRRMRLNNICATLNSFCLALLEVCSGSARSRDRSNCGLTRSKSCKRLRGPRRGLTVMAIGRLLIARDSQSTISFCSIQLSTIRQTNKHTRTQFNTYAPRAKKYFTHLNKTYRPLYTLCIYYLFASRISTQSHIASNCD